MFCSIGQTRTAWEKLGANLIQHSYARPLRHDCEFGRHESKYNAALVHHWIKIKA